ncbi:hypothetical protein Q3G72_018012 [Acer saccharum]|nr:hypothetical protein Q3G72_018012 [Acer saccharum]
MTREGATELPTQPSVMQLLLGFAMSSIQYVAQMLGFAASSVQYVAQMLGFAATSSIQYVAQMLGFAASSVQYVAQVLLSFVASSIHWIQMIKMIVVPWISPVRDRLRHVRDFICELHRRAAIYEVSFLVLCVALWTKILRHSIGRIDSSHRLLSAVLPYFTPFFLLVLHVLLLLVLWYPFHHHEQRYPFLHREQRYLYIFSPHQILTTISRIPSDSTTVSDLFWVDMMTSLVKIFSDLSFSICLMVGITCSSHFMVIHLILVAPYALRFGQFYTHYSRGYDTRKKIVVVDVCSIWCARTRKFNQVRN